MTLALRARPPVRKARFVEREARPEAWRDVHAAADRHVTALARAAADAIGRLRNAVRQAPRTDRLPWPVLADALRRDAGPVVRAAFAAGAEAATARLESDTGTLVAVRKQAPARWRRVRAGLYETDPPVAGQVYRIRRVRETFEGRAATRWRVETAGQPLGTFRTLTDAQAGFFGLVRPAAGLVLRFDLTNPRAVAAAEAQAATMVRRVTEETRRAVRAVIVRAQREGLSIDQQRDRIARLVGLTERQAVAVANFEGALRADGVAETVVRERADAYRARLVRHRARVIARTETMTAANAGQQQLWREATEQGVLDRDVRRRWITTPDDRTCPICRPMGGQVRALEEPFVSPTNGASALTPPVHPQCLPGDTYVLPRGRIRAASKRWFDGDLVVVRVAGDFELACTPNHPILTRHGWIAACALDVGSEVACPGWRPWVGGRDRHNVYAPSRIQDIAEAFFDASAVSAVPVPVSAVDFHGDGAGSEVAIIGADSSLLDGVDTALEQIGANTVFEVGNTNSFALPRLRNTVALSERNRPAASCTMCGGDLSFALSVGHARPFDPLRFRAATTTNAARLEATFDGAPTATKPLRKSVLRNTAFVQPDDFIYREVKSLRHRPFAGFVYNLETTENYYIAGGIATHNCRCATALVVPEAGA